jgi:hypothetical protein
MKIKLLESQVKKIVDEALGDDIPSYMKDIIQKRYTNADRYLKMDVPKHTDIIPNVKVEVQDENITKKTISELIQYFSENIVTQFKGSEMFKVLTKNRDLTNLIIESIGFNPVDASGDTSIQIKRLSFLYSKDFRLPVGKDNSLSDVKFSNNKSNIGNLLKVSSKIFPELSGLNVESMINDKHFVGLRDPIMNYQMNLKKITDASLYLYITDKPDDKLRMSISLFYDSCQNLYTGGDVGTQYNKKLLSNVFDENSKVAYLMFDSPFRDKNGNTHPFSSIARTIIRVNNKGGVMFDRVYPGDMEDIFYSIIENKTGLKNVGNQGDVYHYKGVGLPSPYMDRYTLKNTGENNNEDNKRISALIDVTGYNIKEIDDISDTEFSVGRERWKVYTYEEAIEYTRDYFRDNFTDIFYEEKMETLIDNDILSKESIMDVLDVYDSTLEDEGLEFEEYLYDILGIETLSDFNKILKQHTSRYWSWYRDKVNLEELFNYFGGEDYSMEYALASYNGIIEGSGNYYVFRID